MFFAFRLVSQLYLLPTRDKWDVTPSTTLLQAQRRHLQFTIDMSVVWLNIDKKRKENHLTSVTTTTAASLEDRHIYITLWHNHCSLALGVLVVWHVIDYTEIYTMLEHGGHYAQYMTSTETQCLTTFLLGFRSGRLLIRRTSVLNSLNRSVASLVSILLCPLTDSKSKASSPLHAVAQTLPYLFSLESLR